MEVSQCTLHCVNESYIQISNFMKNATLTLPGNCCINFTHFNISINFSLFFICFMLLIPMFSLAGKPANFSVPGSTATINDAAMLHAGKSLEPLGTTESLRTNLYLLQPDNSLVLADGVYTEYNNLYHDSVTLEDAIKFTNFLENIGLLRYGKTLAVERRPIIKANDTLFVKLWKTTQRNYQIELVANLATNIGLQAYFVDSYLNTSTSLGLAATTKINFAVNADPASAATNRFKIIFKPAASFSPLPVTFTDVKAFRLGEKIAVKWSVENEINMAKYEVEKSLNGKDFSLANTTLVGVKNNIAANYSWLDESSGIGNIFYRIKSISIDGSIKYTAVMKVSMLQNRASFTVYPNPVKGNNVNLQIQNQAIGVYQVKMINTAGQVVYNSKISVNSNSMSQTLNTGRNMPKGIYQLELKITDNTSLVKTIVVQ